MAVSVQVLFDRPQREIASLLCNRLTKCRSASLVAGFMTVEGIEAIAAPLHASPRKLADLVVGAGTWRAYDALDRLVDAGVDPTALRVHLGHSRATGPNAKHSFYRYHPMLHSKVYLLEMPDGTAAAFVGSHNLTGFALLGLNGEAGILLEGKATEPEFGALRSHVATAAAQAVPYDPTMKEAYSWWTSQFIDGLRAKANDIPDPDGAENKRTVVVLAARGAAPLPQKDEVIYFELPSALGWSIRSVDTEVHVYVFPALPSSPARALQQIGSASAALWCTTTGLITDRGGQQLQADWYIDDRRLPDLKRAPRPFQPTPGTGMEQIRVKVRGTVRNRFEYLFDRGRTEWMPVFDEDADEATLIATEIARPMLADLDLVPQEDLPWSRVRGLIPADVVGPEGYLQALQDSAPESGSFVLFSLRRRKPELRDKREKRNRRR